MQVGKSSTWAKSSAVPIAVDETFNFCASKSGHHWTVREGHSDLIQRRTAEASRSMGGDASACQSAKPSAAYEAEKEKNAEECFCPRSASNSHNTQIVIAASNKLISASELMRWPATAQWPCASAAEFWIFGEGEPRAEEQLKEGAEILVGNISRPLWLF